MFYCNLMKGQAKFAPPMFHSQDMVIASTIIYVSLLSLILLVNFIRKNGKILEKKYLVLMIIRE